MQQRSEGRRLGYGVGGENGEERREVRVDHTGTFGDASHCNRAARRVEADGAVLGTCVGRHDRPRCVGPALGGEPGGGLAEAVCDGRDGQRHADHAGGEDERGPGRQACGLLCGLGHGPGGIQAGGAGAGVRDAGVHRDCADPPGPLAQQVRVIQHGGGAHGVAREHARRRAAGRANEQRDVRRAIGLESRVRGRGGEAAR